MCYSVWHLNLQLKGKIMKKFLSLVAISLTFSAANSASARDQVRIVGSSTVYPFATVAAEEFGTKTDFRTPIVEATGTGGGMKLFCSGVDINTPDISNASREIKESEVKLCAKNGVNNIIGVKIGFDGIVLANSTAAENKYDLTISQLFNALAKKIAKDGKLIENPYQKWSEIDASLPDTKIEVYGPPPTSGTRDAFVEIVMEKACAELPEFVAAFPDKKQRKKQCHLIREDGLYIESGENDNLIVQKLKNNTNSLGLFGYSFLEQNLGDVQGSLIQGVAPEFENIADGSYPIARSLYMYAKGEHVGKVTGLKEFLEELVSDDAASEEGYLSMKGLIPLPEEQREEMKSKVSGL